MKEISIVIAVNDEYAVVNISKNDEFIVNGAVGVKNPHDCYNPTNAKALYYLATELLKLRARIKELDSTKHINEIKAQYLESIINTVVDRCKAINPMGLFEPAIDIKTLKGELKKLRSGDD